MEFLKTHYEKLLLAIALVALMGVAIFFVIRVGLLQRVLDLDRQRGKPLKELARDELDRSVAHAEVPTQWRAEQRLFVAPPLVWSQDRQTGAWRLMRVGQVEEKQRTKLPVEWLKKYNLPNVPGVEDLDPDEDGFSNIIEYEYETSPIDPQSQPALNAYLLAVRVDTQEFPLRFKGKTRSQDDKLTFQINVRDFDFTYFVGLGEQVASGTRKEPYKVEKYEEASAKYFDKSLNAEREKDVSRLTLRRLDDESEILLVYMEITIEKSLLAWLRNKLPLPNEQPFQQVKKGDDFKVRGRAYKVVDIKTDAVIILDVSAQQELTLAVKSQ